MTSCRDLGHLFFEKIIPTNQQIDVLYELLKLRQHKISHQTLPSFTEHKLFIQSNPYRIWYLLKINNEYIGSAYLTDQNTLGINVNGDINKHQVSEVIEKIKSEHAPLPAIKSVRPGFFCINVSPTNKNLIGILESRGCVKLQLTFKI